jgi:hypothetical protein
MKHVVIPPEKGLHFYQPLQMLFPPCGVPFTNLYNTHLLNCIIHSAPTTFYAVFLSTERDRILRSCRSVWVDGLECTRDGYSAGEKVLDGSRD